MKRIFFYLCLMAAVVACNDNDSFTTDRSARLTFSKDTVRLDTVFSGVGSSCYTVWVYNRSTDGIRLPKVYLKQGNQTGFRVNVDGTYLDNSTGSVATGLEVRKDDSIRVFIELTPVMNKQNAAQFVSDEIVFQHESGVEQRLRLEAYAWDAVSLHSLMIKKDTLIQSEKPVIVYGGITVDTTATLTIKNTTLYFHDKSGLNIYGKLLADSVTMRGDRLDHMFAYLTYDRISGQWDGVRFYGSSFGNVLKNTEIRSSMFGIRCDSAKVDASNQRLYMERCIVHNCKGNGVELHNSYVGIKDCQITNTLGDCVLAYGGAVLIDGCTIAQFYPFSANRGVGLRFNNQYNSYAYPLELMSVENSILTGYANDELMGTQGNADHAFVYSFSNCLLRTPEVNDTTHFKKIIWEKSTDQINGKKHFVKIDETNFIYDFRLDSLSPAKGLGCYR